MDLCGSTVCVPCSTAVGAESTLTSSCTRVVLTTRNRRRLQSTGKLSEDSVGHPKHTRNGRALASERLPAPWLQVTLSMILTMVRTMILTVRGRHERLLSIISSSTSSGRSRPNRSAGRGATRSTRSSRSVGQLRILAHQPAEELRRLLCLYTYKPQLSTTKQMER